MQPEIPTRPEVIADYACQTGERPLWHADERRLYWTDIPAGKMYRYDPVTRQSEQCYEDRPVGGFTIQADGSLLLFRDRGNVVVWRDGQIERTVIDEIPEERDSRFNDVVADPAGRVFGGTMPVKDAQGKIVRYGRLYLLDCNAKLVCLREGLTTPNGMGFTLDRRRMYFTETGAYTIWSFDYEETTGGILNQRAFIKVAQEPDQGRPDGLCVDSRGNLWSARFDGGCIVCYSSEGNERQRIKLPTPKVTCMTFGGEGLRQLYITTGGGNDRPLLGPDAGALFRVDVGTAGKPEFRSKIAGVMR
jgi:sugar lactone lactonase YvrE